MYIRKLAAALHALRLDVHVSRQVYRLTAAREEPILSRKAGTGSVLIPSAVGFTADTGVACPVDKF